MNKAVVAVSLLLLIIGVALAFCVQETNVREGVIQEKIISPKPPDKLNPGNVTGWAFGVEKSKGIRLELNISASAEVRVIIGKQIDYDYKTRQIIWDETNIIFNDTGTNFEEKVPIKGKDVNYLAIKNEGSVPVELYAHVKKIDYIYEQKYPYSGIGSLIALLGLALLTYGIIAKPKKKYYVKKRRTSKVPVKQVLLSKNI